MKTTGSSVESWGVGELSQRGASDMEIEESQDSQGVIKIVVTFETQQPRGTIGQAAQGQYCIYGSLSTALFAACPQPSLRLCFLSQFLQSS